MNAWRTKSIEQSIADTEEPEHRLRRRLGPLDLTVFGVGVIIGTGIFVLTGKAAGVQAGPAVALSFVFAGIACGLAALCYAEFASTVPVAGSAYTFSYASVGELLAWIIGWDLILELALGAAGRGVPLGGPARLRHGDLGGRVVRADHGDADPHARAEPGVFAMSRDRLLPPVFARVSPRFGTPVRTTLLTGTVVALLATFVPLTELAELVNIGTLFAFVLVAIGVIVLRRTRPDLPRAFRYFGYSARKSRLADNVDQPA